MSYQVLMRLIGLAVFLTVSLVLSPLAVEAQSIPKIGFLELTPAPLAVTTWRQGLLQGLTDLGYVEGQNVVFVNRWAEGREDRLPGLAAELLKLKVDVITSASTEAIIASRNLTKTIPIVMAPISDPIGNGLVSSFARPGTNVTGVTLYSNELAGKRLELLRQVAPKITRVAVLVQRDHPPTATFVSETEAAARALRCQLHVLPVRAEPADIARAFASMIKERDGGVIVQQTGSLNAHMRQMADLATRHRLPTVHASRLYAENGGLLAYGPSLSALGYRAATYVDKILKGAKPADLPVEQPTKFDLVINLKTAKALGLTIPQTLLLRADQVIE
jgi:putative tryptophan/tyrosine transport system substrate-binding protein